MGLYDDYVLPHLIDLACSTKPTRKQREKIVHLAEGDVLEIGFGSGLNLPYYDTDRVRKIFGLEPSQVIMVAAHPRDLRPAAAAGMHTAYVPRPLERGEGTNPDPVPHPDFDVSGEDFPALA